MDIILYLLLFIQYQHKQICWLFNFICRYIPLKQWVFDDSHSPKYQNSRLISSQNNLLRKMGLQRLHSLPRMEVWQENQTCQPPF